MSGNIAQRKFKLTLAIGRTKAANEESTATFQDCSKLLIVLVAALERDGAFPFW